MSVGGSGDEEEDRVPAAEVDAEAESDGFEARLAGSRVLLVEDEVTLAGSLRRLLEAVGCQVVWVHDGAAADQVLRAGEGFDAAVVDVGLPDESGFNVVYALRGGAAPCSAVVMTGDPADDVVHLSIMAGVSDFLVKPFSSALLFAALMRAMEHTRVWRFRLASHSDRTALLDLASFDGRVRSERSPALPASRALDLDGTVERLAKRGSLTAREREAVELLLRGYRNDEIAAALAISAHTAKYHVRNILRKLALESRTDLFRLLIE
jgi:DNA-binding NarL/FixJ family response regulator